MRKRKIEKTMIQCRYEQLAEIFEDKIRSGRWGIGERIPGEIELAKEYHVGRSTIRETLNILQQKGLVEKKHGSGTYILEIKEKMENPLLKLSSTGQMIKAAGYEVGSILYSVNHAMPDIVVRKKMKLQDDEKVVIVNRARTANGMPVVFSYNVFPEKIVGDSFDKEFKGSIFQVMREKCEIKISYADTLIKGVDESNKWDEEALIYLDGPIVLLEQLHMDINGTPVLFSFDYIRTDIMNLRIMREM